MQVKIHTEPETVDLLVTQLSAWLFGFFSGVAAALVCVWLVRALW